MAISVSQAFKDALKGAVDKSQIKVEVYFSAAWVDITSYVLSMSGTLEEANFEGGTSANTLSLSLENSDGRFSRKNTAGPYYYSGAGLVPNKPIRVSCVVGSESVRLFTGFTGPWKTEAASMTCSVGAQDTARILVNQDITEEVIFNSADPNWGRYLTRVIERAAYLSGITWDAVTTLSADWTDLNPSGDGSPEVTGTYTEANLLTANQQGVETDTTGFTKSTAHASASIARVTTKYLRGTASLQVTKTVAGEQSGAYVNKTSGLVAASAYKGWIYLIADSSTPSVPVDVWLRDETNAVTGTHVSATLTPNAWTRVPVTITTGGSAPTDLRLYVETTGATASLIFYADDFWLVKTAGTARATYTLAGDPVMALDLVDLLMPVVAVKGKCLSVLSKLAGVVDGRVYFDAQGQLVFRSPMYRNDSTLSSSETFTVSSLEDVVSEANFEGGGQFAEIVNRAVVESQPLALARDSSGDLETREFSWSLFDKSLFGAGEVYPTAQDPEFILSLPDDAVLYITASPAYPAAADMEVVSVSSSDLTEELNDIAFYAGYPTFSPGSVAVKLQNNGTGSEILTEVKLTTRTMRRIQGCRSVQKNQDSIDLYGQRDKDLSNEHIPTTAACKQLAGWLIEDGRLAKEILTLPVMYGVPWLEVGDKITVSETITNTVPTAEDFIVKRIEWTWGLAAFVAIITACSESAAFVPSGSLPATVTNVETRNINQNSVVNGDLPPAVIDGTQKLIGISTTPAFQQIVGSVRKLTIAAFGSSATSGLAIYKGYLWGVGSSGWIAQIDPLTMTAVNTYQIAAASNFVDCDIYDRYLYISDTQTSGGLEQRIIWFDLNNPGTTQHINWGVKVRLDTLGTNPGQNPRFLLRDGSKLYAHAENTAAVGSIHSRLYRVSVGEAPLLSVTGATNATPIVITTAAAHGLSTGDSAVIAGVDGNTAANGTWTITAITSTTFSLDTSVGNGAYTSGGTSSGTNKTVEVNEQTSANYFDVVANELTMLNGKIWTITASNPDGTLLTAGTSIGATSVLVTSAAGLSVGQPIKVAASMSAAANDDYTYITAINGTTLTVSPALEKAHTTSDYVFGLTTEIASYDKTLGGAPSRTVVNGGARGQGLETDGRYLWASYTDKATKFGIQTGTPLALASVENRGISPGLVRFDGSYIWWTRAGAINQIDYRSGRPLASFASDSTTGGQSSFDGRNIFVTGSSGAIYQVPRWFSQGS